MWKTIDDCVGCSTIFGSCRGVACPYHKRRVLVCDDCESMAEHLYRYEDKDYCIQCLLEKINAVEIDQEGDEEL